MLRAVSPLWTAKNTYEMPMWQKRSMREIALLRISINTQLLVVKMQLGGAAMDEGDFCNFACISIDDSARKEYAL